MRFLRCDVCPPIDYSPTSNEVAIQPPRLFSFFSFEQYIAEQQNLLDSQLGCTAKER